MNNNIDICYGCLGQFPKTADPTPSHPYIGAIRSCWDSYMVILAKEFNNPDYAQLHRITVDSYTAQHIGDQSDRRARQSANLHLLALGLYFAYDQSIDQVLHFLKRETTIKQDWPPITQLDKPSWLTVHHIHAANGVTDYLTRVEQWGRSVWQTYTEQSDIAERLKTFL